jgi:hypothetical protein
MSESSTSNSSVFVSPMIVKPVAAAIYAYAFDKWLLKNTDDRSSMYFGAAVGVTTGIVSTVFSGIDLGLPSNELFSGKTLSQRLAELSAASAGAYAANKYLLRNEFKSSEMMQKIGIIALAELGAEYTADYLSSQPLSFLV